ncbi:MAG: hypothetical protein QW350_01380 [Candidatus Aenigmatarchaeota archaeon]
MKIALVAVFVLLLLSAFLIWRYYSRESRFQESIQAQGIDEASIDVLVEEEVNKAVQNISESDIEAALTG